MPSTRTPAPPDDHDDKAGLSRAGQDGKDQDSNFAEADDSPGPATRGSELPRAKTDRPS